SVGTHWGGAEVAHLDGAVEPAGLDVVGPGQLGQRRLVLVPGLVETERSRGDERLLPVLNRRHPPSGERASVADVLDAQLAVAGRLHRAEEIAVHRVRP